MKHLLKVNLCLICAFSLVGFGYYLNEPNIVEEEKVENIELPFETTKTTVIEEKIEATLSEIKEYHTYCGTYTIKETVSEQRMIADIGIPGTTNTITIECEGIVKVFYHFDELQPTIDHESQRIYFAMPSYHVENYIDIDRLNINETNSIFNPIDSSQYINLLSSLQEKGLSKVEEDDIYTKANQALQDQMTYFMGLCCDYEVMFI